MPSGETGTTGKQLVPGVQQQKEAAAGQSQSFLHGIFPSKCLLSWTGPN